MSFTNKTAHYNLPQYVGTDKPTYLGDANGAYLEIDTQLYTANTTATTAQTAASAAQSTADAASQHADMLESDVMSNTTDIATLKTAVNSNSKILGQFVNINARNIASAPISASIFNPDKISLPNGTYIITFAIYVDKNGSTAADYSFILGVGHGTSTINGLPYYSTAVKGVTTDFTMPMSGLINLNSDISNELYIGISSSDTSSTFSGYFSYIKLT